MGENDKARALKEQSARSGDLRELSYVRGHWREDRPDPLSEPRTGTGRTRLAAQPGAGAPLEWLAPPDR
jgi:hypothetical protein